jgi:hypothetical protein
MQAAVSLIRALGGGWTAQGLPSEKQTLPFGPFEQAPHGPSPELKESVD